MRLLTGLTVAMTLLAAPAIAKPAWDQAANIKSAAERLVVLHRSQGSVGVLKFLDACYKTHTLASDFNAGLESCMAQDYMHTRVLAEIYAKLPEEARAKLHAPSAELIAKTMNARFAAVFAQYKITDAEGLALKQAVDKFGLPVFIKGAFPKANKDEGAAKTDEKNGKKN